MVNADLIRENLWDYPAIEEYFGRFIEERLHVKDYIHGMLTNHLLDPKYEYDLENLERSLSFLNENCEDFQYIFEEASSFKNTDDKILNILAKIKAFEFLYRHDFRPVQKVSNNIFEETIDFIATRGRQSYVIAVHLPKINNLDNTKLSEIISDTIKEQYPRIEDFCRKRTGYKGIFIISLGNDYFVRNQSLIDPPEFKWNSFIASNYGSVIKKLNYTYLNHLVISKDKSVWNTLIYPSW